MEEGGWVERRPDPNDRRVRQVFPTKKARAVFDEIRTMATDVYEQAFAGMTRAERDALIKGLQTVCDNLSDGESPCGGLMKETENAS
jgi:MarR family transcriptional regulator for hemolysin